MTQPVRQWSVSNADGSQTLLTYQWDPAPPAQSMLVGAACAASNVLAGHPAYPGQRIGLSFNQPAHGLNASVIAVGKTAGCLVLSLFKDSPTGALLNPWLDAVQASGVPAWLGYAQEINANHLVPPATYKANVAAMVKTVSAHPAAELVTVVEKFALYADEHGVGHWADYWTGLADLMLWDCYDQTGTRTSADLLKLPIAAAAQANVGWGLGEIGRLKAAADTSGQARADLIAGDLATARAAGARCMLWWDGPGTNADFTLDALGRATWRGLTIAQ